MTDEELRLASHRILGMEHYQDEVQYICEGDSDCDDVISLLQNNSITGKDRTNLKAIALPYLYGTSSRDMITYSSASAGGTSMRSIWRLHTFVNMYGSRYKYIPTKVKKGGGKGKPRLQKVTTKSRNSFDNLTWLDGK